MKVIFVQDVRNIARKGEVKDVAEGYAENFLLPKKLALVATPAILKRVEEENTKRAADTAKLAAESRRIAEELANHAVRFTRKAEKGRLFAAIKMEEVAAALAKDGIKIDKKALKSERPIKMLGEYIVKADLGVVGKVEFSVVVSEE